MTLPHPLLLVAFICFAVATFNPPWPRVNLIALGLAFWIMTLLLIR